MAGTTVTVKLTRNNNQPWGIRLQGGKDFSSPLSLQKVTNGSLAEKAGLLPGDVILRINNLTTENMRHKEAQDAMVQAGNQFEILIQRGDISIWKPTVSNITSDSQMISANDFNPVTKTSLAAKPQDECVVGNGHNATAKPFGQQNGNQKISTLVTKQYNSPASLYSMQTIADTLTDQAGVLSTCATGNNVMKDDVSLNKDSAVYNIVMEEQASPPKKLETVTENLYSSPNTQNFQSRTFKALQKALDDEEDTIVPYTTTLRHVEPSKESPSSTSKSSENLCNECGRLIVGLFVRVKDKSVHSDCFKCSKCSSSLRNVGYYHINDKLYCAVHARQVAKQTVTVSSPVINPLGSSSFTNASDEDVHIVGVAYPRPLLSNSFSPSSNNQASATATKTVNASMTTPKQFTAIPYNSSSSPNVFSSTAWTPIKPVGASTKSTPNAPTSDSRLVPHTSRGILNISAPQGTRIPVCASCGQLIKGPFVSALGKTWCHIHFQCVNAKCRRPLQDIGFIEEQGQLYCELCYVANFAPICSKCSGRIKGDCLRAIGKQWHADCFVCAHCHKAFGSSHFYMEDGLPYCEKDWNNLFTTKCVGCGLPIGAGDRWIEALNSNYHSQCFKCNSCHKNLDGQSFFTKGGRPFCKNHAI